MIIIGYQGIGKSTLAREKKGFIDLESSLFYVGDGQRIDDWHLYYCKIAESLSEQGYVVFVSSHKRVREYLKNSHEEVWIVCPDVFIREQWISKLRQRWETTRTCKDFRAWKGAERFFDENINDLKQEGYPILLINDMTYELEDMIRRRISDNPDTEFNDWQIRRD